MKKIILRNIIIFGAFSSAICIASTESTSIESVIDKLERKLTAESEGRLNRYNATKKSVETIENEMIVEAAPGELGSLANLEAELRRLEVTILDISDDAAKLTQNILAKTSDNTRSLVTVDLSYLDNFNLKKLDITLDGYSLFKFDSSYHVSLPARILPLYSGPLGLGKHSLSLTGSFEEKSEGSINLAGERYATVSQTVTLEMTPEDQKSVFSISLTPKDGKIIEATVEKSNLEQIKKLKINQSDYKMTKKIWKQKVQ